MTETAAYTETPESIVAWAQETFDKPSVLVVATRTNREVGELVSALLLGYEKAKVAEELADCAVMIWQVAKMMGQTVQFGPVRNHSPHIIPAVLATQVQRRFATVLHELYMVANSSFKDSEAHQHSSRLVITDVLSILSILASALEMDLRALVDTKMAVNRARSWVERAPGDFQHAGAL